MADPEDSMRPETWQWQPSHMNADAGMITSTANTPKTAHPESTMICANAAKTVNIKIQSSHESYAVVAFIVDSSKN